MAEISNTAPLPPFLLLPVEIRLMIYVYYIQSYPPPRKNRLHSMQIERPHSPEFKLRRTFEPSDFWLDWRGIPCLHVTNRQIHQEMQSLVHANSIHLTILDDLFFNAVANPELYEFINARSWLRANTRQISL